MQEDNHLIPDSNVKTESVRHLITLIINQDNALASWTKFNVSIQSALFAGLIATMMKSNEFSIELRRPILYGICLLGIAVVAIFSLVFKREMDWQKLYVKKIRDIPEFSGLIYSKHGVTELQGISVQVSMNILSGILFVLWILAMCQISCSSL